MKIREGDIRAVMQRDPSIIDEDDARRFHMGLLAVSMYRESHRMWELGRFRRAKAISYKAHTITGADIHPAAAIGDDFFIDHATGVVIGETTVIGDHVSIYQGVTLGGVSSEKGKRHPTIGDHVVVGANATVLGNITIGNNVRIGAGSVVLKDVPDNSTVVGVPGKIVKQHGIRKEDLKHDDLPDPIRDAISSVEKELEELRERIRMLEE